MSKLLEDWVRYHAGGQYRRYEYRLDRYEKAVELADTLLTKASITIPLDDLVKPQDHILLEIQTLDLPPMAFLFQVVSLDQELVTLKWMPRRDTDKPILLAFRAGAQAAVRHGLTGEKPPGPPPEWVADVLFRHARRNRMNPFETLDLHWTAVGNEPKEAFERLYPRFSSSEEFASADPVMQAKSLAVAKKIKNAWDALDTVEKRCRQRQRWGDLHQLGSATIVLTQKLSALRRSGDEEAHKDVLAARDELEHTEALIAQRDEEPSER